MNRISHSRHEAIRRTTEPARRAALPPEFARSSGSARNADAASWRSSSSARSRIALPDSAMHRHTGALGGEVTSQLQKGRDRRRRSSRSNSPLLATTAGCCSPWPFRSRAAHLRDDLPQVVSLPNRARELPWPCSELYNRDATSDATQLVNANITCG